MAPSTSTPPILWRPSDPEATPISRFRQHLNQKHKLSLRDTHALHTWSITSPHAFWIDLHSYLAIHPPLPSSLKTAYDPELPMSSIPPFFPDQSVNYAENILRPTPSGPKDDAVALIGIREHADFAETVAKAEVLTWRDFRERVKLTASALRKLGIRKGDRVGGLVATSNWAVILFHATAAIGAISTVVSPELGVEGCVSRLKQVEAKVLFFDSHAVYKGKYASTAEKVKEVVGRLETKPEAMFVIPMLGRENGRTIDDFLALADPKEELTYEKVPYNHPLMIVYSSGTTGTPKCIVHSHGLILQVKKISTLHNSLGRDDVIMQYSSTSWVVFYVFCGHLSVGATLICYNGSPLYPDAKQLLRICGKYKVTFLGMSPRLLLEMEMSGARPKHEFDLSMLRSVYFTGATLGNAQYKWFYGPNGFPERAQICNTAGGTDTSSSLVSVDPAGPIYEGEMNCLALGLDIDILDSATGESVKEKGLPGELVIRQPFPSMPSFFWGDERNKKYQESYFERFQDVGLDLWAMHDWLIKNPKTGGYILSGRSDGVLNPSGIRFGSGEVYAIVETVPFTEQISNTLCVGRRRPQDSDEEVFLFVMMKSGHTLTPQFRAQMKAAIRHALSPRHVPKFVLAVPDIPVTINGKKVEVAIKQVISGKDVKASATVQNPESIDYFKRFREIESEPKDAKL